MGFLKVCGMTVELLKKTKALDYPEQKVNVGPIQPIQMGVLMLINALFSDSVCLARPHMRYTDSTRGPPSQVKTAHPRVL